MTEKLYLDLLITDGDITLDSGNIPTICDNRVSIAQDIKHALMESGLVTALIAERSPVLRSDIFLQMILLAEEDERLVPGTIAIEEEKLGKLWLTAETVDFGQIDALEISY
ncbi:Protein of uncharacterised function (DUF2590) [Actinobacillus lignieresii]|uniref:DUF2590 family protein n=1 Tax=Actinobacillus lignieresii TaxID=720 RepID=UPI000E13EABA|nr:DUF2590 family protein [Actinobacillus lignieresii]SUT96051.1 Protein of uncharacterised function (DUF2590) [Actinobacillus lignieresii]